MKLICLPVSLFARFFVYVAASLFVHAFSSVLLLPSALLVYCNTRYGQYKWCMSLEFGIMHYELFDVEGQSIAGTINFSWSLSFFSLLVSVFLYFFSSDVFWRLYLSFGSTIVFLGIERCMGALLAINFVLVLDDCLETVFY